MLAKLLSPTRYRSLSSADRARAAATVAPFLSAKAATNARGCIPFRREKSFDTLETLSDGVATFTSDGVLLHRNPVVAELLGSTRGASALLDAMSASVAALREEHESPAGTSGDGRAAVTGKVDFDGEPLHVQACLLAGRGEDGKPVALVVVTRPQRHRTVGDSAKKAGARYKLTKREIEVAMRLGQRRSNCEIAVDLGLSEHTVRHHTERILRKMGATSRTEVASLIHSSKTARSAGRPAR